MAGKNMTDGFRLRERVVEGQDCATGDTGHQPYPFPLQQLNDDLSTSEFHFSAPCSPASLAESENKNPRQFRRRGFRENLLLLSSTTLETSPACLRARLLRRRQLQRQLWRESPVLGS